MSNGRKKISTRTRQNILNRVTSANTAIRTTNEERIAKLAAKMAEKISQKNS